MNRLERTLLWFAVGTLASVALAWVAFQVQQEQFAPAVLFPLAVGALLGALLLAVRRATAWPGPRLAIAAAVCWGLLLVVAQDYIGHRRRLRAFDEQLADAHPLAMAVTKESDMRPSFVDHLSSRVRQQPWWWTLDLVLTAAAAGGVVAIGLRRRPAEPAPGSD